MNNFTTERNNYRRKLIMLVKQFPILWNKTQENYNRNRPQKMLAWQHISQQLDIPVDKLRRTWENLRDQYRRDLKREVRLGVKSKWRFFADMEFIRSMVSCKEHELKEYEFTDSDSELDVSDNQQVFTYTQCNPIGTTVVTASTVHTTSTACSSTIPSLNTVCSTNILPFQPILLTQQWQPVQEDAPQVSNSLATATHSTSLNLPIHINADYFKEWTPSNNDTALTFGNNIVKQEVDIDMTTNNTTTTTTTASASVAQPETTPPRTQDQNAKDFQESYVSTSTLKNARSSIEEILYSPPLPSTSRSQIKTETELNVKDDDYYFVMSLLPSLRQIPRNRKFPLRISIMSLIAKDLEEVCKE